jgi:hypothetical protein
MRGISFGGKEHGDATIRYRIHTHLPGVCISKDLFPTTIRDSIVFGTVFGGTTNFTPEPTSGGLLMSGASLRISSGDCEEEE